MKKPEVHHIILCYLSLESVLNAPDSVSCFAGGVHNLLLGYYESSNEYFILLLYLQEVDASRQV